MAIPAAVLTQAYEARTASTKAKPLPQPEPEPIRKLVSLLETLRLAGKESRHIPAERFVEIEGQTYYRHWHFPGGINPDGQTPKRGEEVKIKVTKGVHSVRMISEQDALYLCEQERLKQGYTPVSELITYVEELGGTCPAFDWRFVRNSKSEKGDGTIFTYHAICEPDAENLAKAYEFPVVVDARETFFRPEDAEIIRINERHKRLRHVPMAEAADVLQVTIHAVHHRMNHGSLKCVKCGPNWFVVKEVLDAVRAKKRIEELPEDKAPILEFIAGLGISSPTFSRKYIEEEGKKYYPFETIEDGKVVIKKIRIYTAADTKEYVSRADLDSALECDKRAAKWVSTAEFSEKSGIAEATLRRNYDDTTGKLTLFFGFRTYIELDFVTFRNERTINPRQAAKAIEQIKRYKILGEVPENAVTTAWKYIGFVSVPGSRKLLEPHVDRINGVIHLSERLITRTSQETRETTEEYYEYYHFGIPCRTNAPQKEGKEFAQVYFEQEDKWLVEFYTGIMNGTDATKQQLLDILAKVRENRSLTVEEVLMVCIARFAHIVPNESNKKFLYSLFIEKTEIGGRQVDALDYRVFNERTLARIPDRYFVPKRLGANSNIIETTDTDALLPAI